MKEIKSKKSFLMLLITICLILATTTFVPNIPADDESCINNLNAIFLSNAEELMEVQATRLVNDELNTAAENWTLEELNTFLEDLEDDQGEDEDDQGEDEDEELEFKPGYLSADQTFTAMVSYGFLAGDSGDLEAYRELYHDPYSLEGNVSTTRNFQVLKQYDFIPSSISQSDFRKLGGRMGLIIRGFEGPIPTPPAPNNAPTITGEIPANTGTEIYLQPTCEVTVNDADGDMMDVTFASNYTGNWVNYQTNGNVSDGSNVFWSFTGANTSNKTYWWRVYADDGIDNISETYHFITEALDYEIVWDKLWGLEYECQIDAVDLAIDDENNIFVIGDNDSQGVILKYDEDGNLLSEEDTESYESLRQLEITNLSEYMQGMPNPLENDDYDFFMNITLQEYEKQNVYLHDIELNKETNELFIEGTFFCTEDGKEMVYCFITKYEISGNSLEKQWTKSFGASILITSCYAFTIDAESNIYLPIMFPSILVKLSSDGQVDYVKPITIGDFFVAIVLNPSTGNIIIDGLDYKFIDPAQSKMVVIELELETGNKLNEVTLPTPYLDNYYIPLGRTITCASNGDIFATSLYYEQDCYKTKLVKLNKNLIIQFIKNLSYPITGMKIIDNYLITVGVLLTDNGNIYYGATVLSITNGNLLLLINLGSFIYTFDLFGGNRMQALVIDNEGDLVSTGCRGNHSDAYGLVSCIKTTKFRLNVS